LDRAYAVNANQVPGSVWTWLGATLGADWATPRVTGYNPIAWGANCDGITDDTATFRNMIAAFNTNGGGLIQFPSNRTCIVNVSAGPFVLTAGGTVTGYGIPGAGGGSVISDSDMKSSSILRDVSGGANPIFQVATGMSVSFRDIMLDAVPAKPATAFCVEMIGVAGTSVYQRSGNFERTEFRNCNGIDIGYAVDLRVVRSIFLDYPGCAISENQRNGDPGAFDYGDWRVTDSLFFDLTVTSGSAFCQLVGSGGTFLSNTVNGGEYGYYMNWNGAHSEETRIVGNIINQQTKASVAFFQGTPGTAFSEIIVSNNNFSTQVFAAGDARNPKYGSIYVEKGVPPNFDPRWFVMAQITNNTFNNCYDNSQGAKAAIWVRDGDNIMIAHNQIIMNNDPAYGPCSNAMVTGVSFIQTEGSSYAGDANRSGVLVCSVTDNIISFAYQDYSPTSGYMPMYGQMAPLCVIDDAQYHTYAADPHLGYSRTIEKAGTIIPGSVTGWTTIDTLTPSTTTGLNAVGVVHAVINAHTALTAFGVNDSLWWYQYNNGTLTTGPLRADQIHDSIGGGGFPQFRLNPASGVVHIQVQSSDGTHTIDGGQMHFTVELAAPENVATTFYWQLLPTSP
jgi:hypothetical protein